MLSDYYCGDWIMLLLLLLLTLLTMPALLLPMRLERMLPLNHYCFHYCYRCCSHCLASAKVTATPTAAVLASCCFPLPHSKPGFGSVFFFLVWEWSFVYARHFLPVSCMFFFPLHAYIHSYGAVGYDIVLARHRAHITQSDAYFWCTVVGSTKSVGFW